ncbi:MULTISPECIES: GerMN domain-containing protein [unclassified Coleofasciculus]|uniref:GerMN domain-containing protein n=1 Tax=unclassified Coleofasciculus TaxID=2692782 RepID=UPI00187FD2A1|nr:MULTISPECIES: GerMN domain-containing protein [unclassified Coleofasciculus]MBE9129981.1 GerMN domain-containing protein [Coleofasciculus sp. LEGE 07081]MBE9151206.1 GerMN domain-containing protein [Coleofasciculus sp. LEGE 07092]
MQDRQNARRIPLGMAAGLSVALLAAGGGGAWWAWNSVKSATTPPVPSTSESPQSVQPSTEEKIEVYWIDDVNGQVKLVPNSITLKQADSEGEVLQEAFNRLLVGPIDQTVATTIPEETKLRTISVESDGVHVDLSAEFTGGGGSSSMMGRLAQVLYTATSLDPTAKVWIDVEGQPLEVLGGEGILVEQPMTRQDFEENFPL